MISLLQIGNTANVPTKQYYVESEEELAEIKDAPAGSIAMILTLNGLIVKMLHSSSEWVEI